jgi:hypothetical protein
MESTVFLRVVSLKMPMITKNPIRSLSDHRNVEACGHYQNNKQHKRRRTWTQCVKDGMRCPVCQFLVVNRRVETITRGDSDSNNRIQLCQQRLGHSRLQRGRYLNKA